MSVASILHLGQVKIKMKFRSLNQCQVQIEPSVSKSPLMAGGGTLRAGAEQHVKRLNPLAYPLSIES